MILARSSLLSRINSYQRRRMPERSLALRLRQAGKAAEAAAMARRVSVAPIFGTVPSWSPLAGLLTASVVPSSASDQAPSI